MIALLVITLLVATMPFAPKSKVYTMTQGDEQIAPKGRGVKFTRPDGSPVYVNAATIAFVRESLSTEAGKTTIVFASGAKQAVMEPIEDVIADIHIEVPGDKEEEP